MSTKTNTIAHIVGDPLRTELAGLAMDLAARCGVPRSAVRIALIWKSENGEDPATWLWEAEIIYFTKGPRERRNYRAAVESYSTVAATAVNGCVERWESRRLSLPSGTKVSFP